MTPHQAFDTATLRPGRKLDDERKSAAAAKAGGAARLASEVIRIEDFALARQLLRSGSVRQAGFRAELLERFTGRAHAPVLFQDGEAHQKQRSATARFFAPKVVATRYRDLMQSLSDRLVAGFRAAGRGDTGLLAPEALVKGVPILDPVILAQQCSDVVDRFLLVGRFQVQIDVLGMEDVRDGNHKALIMRCRST